MFPVLAFLQRFGYWAILIVVAFVLGYGYGFSDMKENMAKEKDAAVAQHIKKQEELYVQLQKVQVDFATERALIDRLRNNAAAVCAAPVPAAPEHRDLLECRRLLSEGAELLNQGREALLQCREITKKEGG